VNSIRNLICRILPAWRWVAAQFAGMLLLLLIGLAWTRLPEKHVWQVLLSLLLPLLLVAATLVLQAGTIRRLAEDDGKRVNLAWGAATLLFWAAVLWVSWALLDWCDDRIPNWASYLNSQAPARWRAKLLTFDHLQHGLTFLEWVLRWIVVPGKIYPYAATSAQWGWRMPWRRVLRLLWNWRWWLGVSLASLFAVWLPGKFFAGLPHGSVSAQVWAVGFKLAGAYLLAISGWILLQSWAAALFASQQAPPEDAWDAQLFERLRTSRRWIGASFGWMVLYVLADRAIALLQASQSWIIASTALILIVLALLLAAGTMRSLLGNHVKPVRMAWGTLCILLWTLPFLGIALLLAQWRAPLLPWLVGWFLAPAILLPFAATSTVWGLRLPWRPAFRLLGIGQWWLAVAGAAVIGVAFPAWIDAAWQSSAEPTSQWAICLKESVNGLLAVGSGVLLLGWLGVLFNRRKPVTEEISPAPSALTGPEAVALPADAQIATQKDSGETGEHN